MLKQRIITAAILIPLTLAILFYLPPTAFFMMTALFVMACGWEWGCLAGMKSIPARLIYILVIAAAIMMAAFVAAPLTLAIGVFWWLLAFILVLVYPRLSGGWGRGVIWRSIMGIFVLIPCWVSLNYLRNLGGGMWLMFYLFVLIWGADSVAYFVGRAWGKTKLAPTVSPGKSWQGFIGALVFSVVAAISMWYIIEVPRELRLGFLLLSVITVVFSVIGDLFESMMKRKVDLKDSGSILPGHGGLLDRIDSLTAAGPVFAFGFLLLLSFA